jgi:ABC-type Fe3+ transport system permease subunit
VAAALLELGILFRRARARGLPITNLYAGAWYAVIVSIPGLVVAAAPLVAFQLARSGGSYAGLFAMGLIALGELALAVPFALGRGDS